jgi:hypothetical protein
MNADLYGITCVQKFEDTIQVAFGLDLNNKKNFEFAL